MQLLKDIRRRLHSSPQVWEPIWPQDSILICTSVTKTEQCVNVQCVCVCQALGLCQVDWNRSPLS